MLEPKDTITLSLGSRFLTIIRLRGQFIGLIDGTYYVSAASAEAVVAALIRVALRRPEPDEMKKKRSADSAKLVRSAQEAAGDAVQDGDITKAEQACIDEVRRDLPRPNAADIKEMARRLARN